MPEPSLPEESIFAQALELTSAAERAAFLDRACGDKPALRAGVEALLRAHERSGDLLDLPENTQPATELPAGEVPGTVIGPYKLLEQIGEGGMGTVWMAEQTEPIQRRVAVKVVKEGMDSRQVLARFEAERQALALMEHPNIAKVLDAGKTPSGRPYFVMELVKGQPITKYCDDKRLGVRERLELFGEVCRAVQHAHQKGIIHRDLKPSNVLVAPYDGKPVVKVIDFGVAKATGQRLTDKTLFTGFGALVGTPEYMSPEQAEVNNQDIDTRSDIYSLGVLLYELLTGSTPLTRKRLKEAAILEVLRVIREEEPPKPSTRLSESKDSLPSISAQRQMEPGKLTKLVRGELDWIVMKALEKDRNRRYETANGLAMDIQRYLADEAVQACPPSAWYRFRKFSRRNKRALTTAVLLALALLVTVAVLAISNVLIGRERDQTAQALYDKEAALRNESAALVRATEQEGLAKKNAATAEKQREAALEQERIAKSQTLLARRRFYAAQINLASQAAEAGNPARALDLLDGQKPRMNEEDLRTFEWRYLWRQLHRGRRLILRGHKGWIGSVAFAPDSRTLASSSFDGTVRLWDVASGNSETVYSGNGRDVNAVAFSPDGKTLAWSSHDRIVRTWDVGMRRLRWSLAGHTDMVWSLAFSPDGTTLVTGSQDNTVRLWDLAAGKALATLAGHDFPVLSVAFSPDGKTVASASSWKTGVKIWDVATRKERLTVAGCTPVAFLPDGALVCLGVVGQPGGGVTLWDVRTGKKRADFKGIGGRLAVAVSAGGKTVGFGAVDRNVMLWDVVTDQNRAHHARLAPIHSLAFSPDGKLVASGADDGVIELWDMAPAVEATLLPNASLVAFSADGSSVVAGSWRGVKRWEAATGTELGSPLPHTQGIGPAALSRDSRVLAAVKGKTIELWHMATGQKIRTLQGHRDVHALALAPDGKRLVSTSRLRGAGTTKLWDLDAGSTAVTINDGSGNIFAMAFSPDGKMLATAGQEFELLLWDPKTGRKTASLQGGLGHHLNAWSLAFSPDSKSLAVGGTSGSLQLWDVATRRMRANLRGQTETIHALAFSRDGLTLASGSADGIVKLWDVHTGQERLTLKGHSASVTSATFANDGLTLATGSSEGIRLWRAAALSEKETAEDLAESAAALMKAGRTDEASQTFRRAVGIYEKLLAQTHGDNANLLGQLGYWRRWLAGCLYDAGNAKEAEELFGGALNDFEKLSAAHPHVASPRRFLADTLIQQARCLKQLGRLAETEKTYRRAIAVWKELAAHFPTEPFYQREVADTYWAQLGPFLANQNGRLGDAEQAYRLALAVHEKLIADFPMHDPEYHRGLGGNFDALTSFLQANGKIKDAEKVRRQVLELYGKLATANPQAAEFREQQGRIYSQLRQWDKAIDAYTQGIAVKPKHWELWSDRGFARLALHQWEKCIDDYTEAIKLAPDVHTNWHHRGLAYGELGQWDKVVYDRNELLKRYPNDCNAFHFRALAYVKLKQPEKAVADLRQAFAKGYKDLEAVKQDGRFAPLRNREDFKKFLAEVEPKIEETIRQAMAANEKLVAESPNKPQYKLALIKNLGELVRVLSKGGRYEEAAKTYSRLVELAPTSAVLNNNTAWFLATCPEAKFRDPGRAVTLAKKATELDSKKGTYWNTLGAAQYRAGDWKAAIAALDKSMELRKGGDSFDWLFLAMAHWQLGEKEKARTRFDQAVEWMDKHQPMDEELRRFRAEAAELLGVQRKK